MFGTGRSTWNYQPSWRLSPAGRVAGTAGIILLGAIVTHQIIGHSTAGAVTFALFVTAVLVLAIPRDYRAIVVRQSALGGYWTVSGFGSFGGVSSTPVGLLGIIVLLVLVIILIVLSRQHRIGTGHSGAPPSV